MIHNVLAIETSCDDTSIAVIRHDGFVESMVSANQDLAHAPFGGVVPEIAGRYHSEAIMPLVHEALRKANTDMASIGGIAVTNRPGLIGSLIVGVVTAKSLALAYNKPLLAVNHLEGHLLAPFLRDAQYAPPEDFRYPYVALAISGGHTILYKIEDLGRYVILGSTRDDAAGEAFDKFAKMMGLGFPGGLRVDQNAKTGDPAAFAFPRSLLKEDTLDMSFSGLKASAQRQLVSMMPEEVEKRRADLCASFQEAIVDVLVHRLDQAVTKFRSPRALLTGGVSANSRLREKAQAWAQKRGIQLVIPPLRYCTDNAAMIGLAGVLRFNRGETSGLNMAPSPHHLASDFVDGRA